MDAEVARGPVPLRDRGCLENRQVSRRTWTSDRQQTKGQAVNPLLHTIHSSRSRKRKIQRREPKRFALAPRALGRLAVARTRLSDWFCKEVLRAKKDF